jgi:hypothetical protein
MFSQKLVQAVMQPNTGEVFLLLVTFNHSSFDTPIRLVNNLEPITSRGNEYMAFPIDMVLPPDDGDTLPTVQITCQNASLELIDEVRSVQGPMSLTIEMIMASSPDYVEASIGDLRVANAQYDKNTIQLTATVDDLLNTSFPKEKYQPGNFPGLFK